ncbi:MAG: Bug family tripartite tricarboxylate transporter substrate binding protein [Betaproteobacteria bacterium]|jgi:tripartite-type tricarboxylate transporter receptor subunit TctC
MANQAKRHTHRFLLAALMGCVTLGLTAYTAPANAQAFPNKPVRLIVPFVAGGATDIVARLVAQKLSAAWGQPVVVENRGGAGGNIGADAVAKSPADGYTILVTSGSIVTVNPHMYAKMPFDAKKDLAPITNLASGPQVLVVHPAVPAKNVKELVALAKSKPGQLNFGSAGIGSQVHMAAEAFVYAAGIEAQHIPYKGEAVAFTDLAGGQVQFMVGNIAGATGHIQSGRIRALGVTSAKRSPQLPDVPTVAEAGLPGFENTGWFGFMAPAGTPKPIIDKIHADTVKVLADQEVKDRLTQLGMAPVGNSPADFTKEIAVEYERWGKVVTARKITAN